MIVIRFLKVQNEWVVFKNDSFSDNETIVFENDQKTKQKTIVFKTINNPTYTRFIDYHVTRYERK